MTKPDKPQWYTIREAAEYLQVGEPTIYRWMRDSKITFRKVGDSTRFLQEDLDEMVSVHRRKADAKRVTEACQYCGHDELVDGHLQSTGMVYFRPTKTKFWNFRTADVKTTAKICLNCGGIHWFGDLGKLEKLAVEKDGAEE